MNYSNLNSVYFIGVGGIGMSALARFFLSNGCKVYGYDRVASDLTKRLESEGIIVQYTDEPNSIPSEFLNADLNRSIVIYTPAIPRDNQVLNFLINRNFLTIKRSEALQQITASTKTIAIAGTHGKTTTSAMIAHLLLTANIPANAFLGGISVNYDTNCLLSKEAEYSVVEADEYDRSFLKLSPEISVITSIDPDHLDIYQSADSVYNAFEEFAQRLKPDGALITANDIGFESGASKMSYGLSDGPPDLTAQEIDIVNGNYEYTVVLKGMVLGKVVSRFPGLHNIENSLAAVAVGLVIGIDWETIRTAIETFNGVKRRFEYQINSEDRVFIDDYAHHPREISACVGSVKELYPTKRITGVFQPHLFSRTRDFSDDFAESLKDLNDLILMEIYPAREEPIEGVSSSMLLDKVQMVNKKLCQREDLIDEVLRLDPEVLLTMGAGDIDKIITPLKNALNKNNE